MPTRTIKPDLTPGLLRNERTQGGQHDGFEVRQINIFLPRGAQGALLAFLMARLVESEERQFGNLEGQNITWIKKWAPIYVLYINISFFNILFSFDVVNLMLFDVISCLDMFSFIFQWFSSFCSLAWIDVLFIWFHLQSVLFSFCLYTYKFSTGFASCSLQNSVVWINVFHVPMVFPYCAYCFSTVSILFALLSLLTVLVSSCFHDI